MYEPIIGLEVHLQPNTRSKMFCTCDAVYFGASPNTHTCPVCMGLPGALPVPNKIAIEKCMKLGLALDCKINQVSKFDRKNYFYPDLPKGYQISQYDLPFCYEGFLEIMVAGDARRIRITRIHLEEDTAKSMHTDKETLVDFNKSGVPLIEIVTEPDFKDVKEVRQFSRRLRQIVRYLDISNADMEKGQMRFELNMSVRKAGEKGLPDYKVEVKNIASISVLEKVIEFEFDRQTKLLENGEKPAQETRGLKDMSGVTLSQRLKEESEDYRYFPEPDIPSIKISDKWLSEIRETLTELPHQRKARLMEEYSLEPDSAETAIISQVQADWYESGIPEGAEKKQVQEYTKWFIGDFMALKKESGLEYDELKIKSSQLFRITELLHTGKLSGSLAKRVLIVVFETGKDPEEVIKEEGLEIMGDQDELKEIILEVIEKNPKVVADSKKNPNAAKFLLGQVMGRTKGKADPKVTMSLINKELGISDE